MPRTTSSLASATGLGACAGKDQRRMNWFDLEETRQRVGLVVFVDKIIALFGRCQGERITFNGDRLRVAHEAAGERADATRQRRAE